MQTALPLRAASPAPTASAAGTLPSAPHRGSPPLPSSKRGRVWPIRAQVSSDPVLGALSTTWVGPGPPGHLRPAHEALSLPAPAWPCCLLTQPEGHAACFFPGLRLGRPPCTGQCAAGQAPWRTGHCHRTVTRSPTHTGQAPSCRRLRKTALPVREHPWRLKQAFPNTSTSLLPAPHPRDSPQGLGAISGKCRLGPAALRRPRGAHAAPHCLGWCSGFTLRAGGLQAASASLPQRRPLSAGPASCTLAQCFLSDELFSSPPSVEGCSGLGGHFVLDISPATACAQVCPPSQRHILGSC